MQRATPVENQTTTLAPIQAIDILGGKKTLGTKRYDDYRQGRSYLAIKSGLPYQALEELSKRLQLSKKEVLTLIDIAPRTLHRRKVERVLPARESDRLFRLARIYARAIQVLEDEKEALAWFRHLNYNLGEVTPLSLLETAEGARLVENELNGIAYSVY